MTARKRDANGWYEVARNPLSKVGVFPYMGRQLGLSGADANRVVQVYRPAEELGSPETLDSFRLVPLIDDHTMLGPEEAGRTPAAKKGVHGVIGDRVGFDGETLYGNLRLFSEDLAQKIDGGKRQLSLGYACVYDFTPGVFNGKAYDAVQRRLRGNHVALVKEGRMGPDVAVLDQMIFTVDAKDITPMRKALLMATAAHAAAIAANAPQTVIDACDAAVQAAKDDDAGAEETEDAKAAADALAAKEAAEKEAADAKAALKVAQDALAAATASTDGADALAKALTEVAALRTKVDALTSTPALDEKTLFASVAQRDALAKRLAPHVGTFDHSGMTLGDVVAYGCDKLDLKNVTAGHELTALDAYLTAKPAPAPVTLIAADAANKDTALTRWVAGK